MRFQTDTLRVDETCSHDFHGLGDACEEKYFRGKDNPLVHAPNIACTLKLDDYYDLSCAKSIVIHFNIKHDASGHTARLLDLRYAGLVAYCVCMQREHQRWDCNSREYMIKNNPRAHRWKTRWWMEIVGVFSDG